MYIQALMQDWRVQEVSVPRRGRKGMESFLCLSCPMWTVLAAFIVPSSPFPLGCESLVKVNAGRAKGQSLGAKCCFHSGLAVSSLGILGTVLAF